MGGSGLFPKELTHSSLLGPISAEGSREAELKPQDVLSWVHTQAQLKAGAPPRAPFQGVSPPGTGLHQEVPAELAGWVGALS